MLVLGCKPPNRHTEQHDVYFGIGTCIKDLLPGIKNFWKNAGTIHIDSYRAITNVDNYSIKVVEGKGSSVKKLFFLNLGGYKHGDLEEHHYKVLAIAEHRSDAIMQSKQTAFYKHTGFKGAESHIDDKYGVDVDDIYEIADILDDEVKQQFSIVIERSTTPLLADELHIGYLNLDKVAKTI
jgi:hypothetical protein